MSEFIWGLTLFVIGTGLLIHNKRLVENSVEFYPRNLRPEKREQMILFDRFLCAAAGLFTLVFGFLTMLFSNG